MDGMTNFPQRLRDLRPDGLPERDEDALCRLLGQPGTDTAVSSERHPPPHYPELLRSYIATGHLPPGRYLIYGTGHVTRDALPALASGPFEIVAFLDRNAPAIGCYCDRPVILPEDAPAQIFDHVLILHLTDEESMQKRLLAAGVPAEKIVTLQMNHRYRGFVIDQRFKHFRERYPGEVPYLIVSSLAAQWSIVPHQTLARLFPPARTVHLFMGSYRQIETYDNDLYEAFCCMRSVELLSRCIDTIRPKVIYLKTSPHAHSEYLFSFLKSKFPKITIINEINDWSSLFSDVFLRDSLGYTEQGIMAARYANYDALRRADLVICKSGGPAWEELRNDFSVPCLTYFPHLDQAASPPSEVAPDRGDGGPVRILFAGTIGIDETPEDASRSQGSNFLRYLRLLGSTPGLMLDIFNSGHMNESADHVFAPIIAHLVGHAGSSVVYHRLHPFAELVRMARQWDFGLAASHYAEDRVENVTRVGIGNKLMGYVVAGIPAIIDNRYGFASALIERFEAGIVIEPERLESLPALLLSADRSRLRAGMARLRAHLSEHNAGVLERMGAVVAGARAW